MLDNAKAEGKKYKFKYDGNLSYNGRRIQIDELGAWVLNNRGTLKYVHLWEAATEAQLNFRLGKTAAKLQILQQCVGRARALPP